MKWGLNIAEHASLSSVVNRDTIRFFKDVVDSEDVKKGSQTKIHLYIISAIEEFWGD